MLDIFRRGGQQINLCQLNLQAVTFPITGDVVAGATPRKLNLQRRLYKRRRYAAKLEGFNARSSVSSDRMRSKTV